MTTAYQTHIETFHSHIAAGAYTEALVLLMRLASALFQAGAAQTAADLFLLLPESVQSTDPDVLITRGDACRLCNSWLAADTFYEQARCRALERADTHHEARAISRLALVCWLRGDIAGALQQYERIHDWLIALPDDNPAWEECIGGYALALASYARIEEAESLLLRQHRHFQRRVDATGQRMTLLNLGMMVYIRRGDFLSAETVLNEALKLAVQSSERLGEAYVANSLAYMYALQRRMSQSLDLSLRALMFGKSYGLRNVVAFACVNQALVYAQQKNLVMVEQMTSQALAHLDSALTSPLYCEVLLVQAKSLRTHIPADAYRSAVEAVAAARLQNDQWLIGQCLLEAGLCAFAINHLDAACQALHEAQLIFTAYQDRYHLLYTHMLGAQIEAMRPDWHALEHHISFLLSHLTYYPDLFNAMIPKIAPVVSQLLSTHPQSGLALYKQVITWGRSAEPLIQALLHEGSEAVRLWAVSVLEFWPEPWAWAQLAHHGATDPALRSRIKPILQRSEAMPMPELRIQSFGAVVVAHGDCPIVADKWSSLQAQLMLIYLALNGPTTRDELIELLWPDEPLDKTGMRLRSTVRLLRRSLQLVWNPQKDYIVHQHDHYQIAPTVVVDIDVRHFQQQITLARNIRNSARYAACNQALTLYRGSFMPGWFQDWVVEQREVLMSDWLWAQEEHATGLLEVGQAVQAEWALRTVIQHDPLREQSWQLLMMALRNQGRKADALTAYRSLCDLLDKTFNAKPDQATQALFARINDTSFEGFSK